MQTIRALELTTLNKADTIRFESLATTEMADKFGVMFGKHYIGTGYIKHMHHGSASLTRGAVFVTVMVDSINGVTIDKPTEHEYVWGAHVHVEIMDPDEYEPDDETKISNEEWLNQPCPLVITEDDIESMFGMPDPDSDGPVCGFPSCATVATRVGLRQVENPSASHPEGIQSNDPVCEYHAMTWSGLWGTWPIEDDFEYGVGIGGNGPVSKLESERRYGNITDETFAAEIHAVMDSIETTGVVSLDKSDDAGFVESNVQPERQITAGQVAPGMIVRFTHRVQIISGTVDAIDPFEDARGRIGVYLVGDKTKYRMRTTDPVVWVTQVWAGGLFSHA